MGHFIIYIDIERGQLEVQKTGKSMWQTSCTKGLLGTMSWGIAVLKSDDSKEYNTGGKAQSWALIGSNNFFKLFHIEAFWC